MKPNRELVMGGGSRDIEQAQHIGGMDILIKGPATELGKRSGARLVAGYAVTDGVSKDAWDAWFKDNKDSDMVRNELIFMRPGDDSRADDGQAKENRKRLSGMEPLDPDNDVRRPRPSRSKNVADVTDEDGDRPGSVN
jgi:hypothetical protein